MQTQINASDVTRRVIARFRDYNNRCPEKVGIRPTKNGPKEFRYKEGTIKAPLKTTFNAVLTFYLNDYKAHLEIRSDLRSDDFFLNTNNVDLAAYLDCCEKTVYNHLEKLRELKIIRTQFRGTKCNYKLWITDEILHGNQEKSKFQKRPQNDLNKDSRKNLPLINTQCKNIKHETSNADMFICQGKDFQGKKGKTDQPSGVEDSGKEEKKGGAARLENLQITSPVGHSEATNRNGWLDERIAKIEEKKPKGPSGLMRRYVEMLLEFWFHAHNNLFKNRDFDRDQQEEILLTIARNVYGDFKAKWTDDKWLRFHLDQIEKLDLAAKYLDKHPLKYASDPIAIHKAGTGYFDSNNPNGFIRTQTWLDVNRGKAKAAKATRTAKKKQKSAEQFRRDEEKRHAQIRLELMLKTARTDFEKLHRGQEPRQKVAHCFAALSPQVALFNYWKDVFTQLTGRGGCEVFLLEYQQQQARHFKQPDYAVSKRLRSKSRQKVDQADVVYWQDWMDEGGYFTTV